MTPATSVSQFGLMSSSGGHNPRRDLRATEAGLFFVAEDLQQTAAPVVLVARWPSAQGLQFRRRTVCGTHAGGQPPLFGLVKDATLDWWATDGTANGTWRVKDHGPFAVPVNVQLVGAEGDGACRPGGR